MMKDKTAKSELLERLNIMYENFWDSFENKFFFKFLY